MLEFAYTPSKAMAENMATTINGYRVGPIKGILEENKTMRGSRNPALQLWKNRIYLVCHGEAPDNDSSMTYDAPLAVVAFNDTEAVQIYHNYTKKPGAVMAILENKADKAEICG